MALFKFDDNDIFINTLESYPEYSFYVVSGNVFIDNFPNLSGSHDQYTVSTAINNKFEGAPILGVPEGYISLYEYNINRGSGSIVYEENPNKLNDDTIPAPHITSVRLSETDATGSLMRPFVVSDGFKHSVKTYGDSDSNVLFNFGEIIEGSYQMSASITQYNYTASARVRRIINGKKSFAISGQESDEGPINFSIANVLSKYLFKSPHMKMITEAPLPVRDLRTDECAVTNIPSIFYGKKIKPGSVELNYYVTGTLIGTLKDNGYNGELRQTFSLDSPIDYSGSVAGIVLYNEGLVILTGSYQLGMNNSIDYVDELNIETGTTINKWTHFGSGLHAHKKMPGRSPKNIEILYGDDAATSDANVMPSFELKFQGVTEKQTMLMMSYARQGELNWSNNPTFIDQGSSYLGTYYTSSNSYKENDVQLANITDTKFSNYTPEHRKETYITKVAIYDKRKNLIGIATVANPVRKTEDRNYTFKLKLDL
tara:strand:- start:2791 stop:4242 length:1452 start_codon:yes stop_codon:yes gene_type:complete